MKIEDLEAAQRLHADLTYWGEARASLRHQPLTIRAGECTIVCDDAESIAYAGEYCDDVLEPLLDAFISRRIENIVERLRSMGVVVPE